MSPLDCVHREQAKAVAADIALEVAGLKDEHVAELALGLLKPVRDRLRELASKPPPRPKTTTQWVNAGWGIPRVFERDRTEEDDASGAKGPGP